jgi:putative hydrolase of the HAD superfamily
MRAKRKLKSVKFLLFDIDDTLFPSGVFAKKARANAVRAMVRAGLNAGEREAFSLLQKIIAEKGTNHPRHFDFLCRKLGAKNPSKLIAAGVRAYHDTKREINPYPGAKAILGRLKKRGLALCIATEGIAKKQWDKLIRLSLENSFSRVFISDELGCKKSRRFYAKICRMLHAAPRECAMIGDNPKTDILPARKAGMASIRVLKGKHQNKKCKADFNIRSLGELEKLLS